MHGNQASYPLSTIFMSFKAILGLKMNLGKLELVRVGWESDIEAWHLYYYYYLLVANPRVARNNFFELSHKYIYFYYYCCFTIVYVTYVKFLYDKII